MSLQPEAIGPIPEETARVARAAFPDGATAMRVRDELGTIYQDDAFADLFSTRGRPAESPWRLALVSVLQFAEGLPDRKAVDAKVVLRGVRPRAIPAQEGRLLKRLASARSIRYALKRNARTPIELGFELLKPKIESVEYRGAVVIMRSSNRLLFYNRKQLVRSFGIATGQSSFPTPLGNYEIVNMQRNPWWYPPPSDWAADSDPVPPGPGNPLGTRWMGLSAPYVGIHGTPDAASIGYSASHGCIRMRIPDAEWLFRRVEIGMPVFIVAR